MLEALDDPRCAGLDLSSWYAMSSTAALFSPSVKDQFHERFPNIILSEAIGASETGSSGYTLVQKGQTAMKGGPTVTPIVDNVVLDEDIEVVTAGSGRHRQGRAEGQHPARVLQGPGEDGRDVRHGQGGVRYAIPGDFATVEADGTITLLGRGSVSINSGGEKIYPEEVEGAVKGHPAVYDCVVVGVPDETWGQRVAAVVQPRAGVRPTLESIQEHCRTKIAGYKLPRELHFVDTVVRSPSGKPDYRWAKEVATS